MPPPPLKTSVSECFIAADIIVEVAAVVGHHVVVHHVVAHHVVVHHVPLLAGHFGVLVGG